MGKRRKRKRKRERERIHPFSSDNSSVQRSPSNQALHLFSTEMRLDSISRSIWFRREGASWPISIVLVGNVYHLLAVRTYALCGSVIHSPGEKHKQLMVGRWWSDDGREASWGKADGRGGGLVVARLKKKEKQTNFFAFFSNFFFRGRRKEAWKWFTCSLIGIS